MVQIHRDFKVLNRKNCVKTTFVERNYFSQMPAKGKDIITVVNPGPKSDASLTAELEKLTVEEDNDDNDGQIVKSFSVGFNPLVVRGLMVHDTSGEWYAPQIWRKRLCLLIIQRFITKSHLSRRRCRM